MAVPPAVSTILSKLETQCIYRLSPNAGELAWTDRSEKEAGAFLQAANPGGNDEVYNSHRCCKASTFKRNAIGKSRHSYASCKSQTLQLERTCTRERSGDRSAAASTFQLGSPLARIDGHRRLPDAACPIGTSSKSILTQRIKLRSATIGILPVIDADRYRSSARYQPPLWT